jgi:tetratricopeptide (TPR) repeat protein
MNSRELFRAKLLVVFASLSVVAFGAIFELSVKAESNSGLTAALHKAKVFPASSGATVSLIDRQAVVEVFHVAADGAARRKAAIFAARALVNYAAGQFNTIAVKFYDQSGTASYSEIIVNARDITSLVVGTIKLDELAVAVSQVDISPSDSKVSIFNKYLGAAEKQIEQGHYWEAEQIVDSAARIHGNPPETNGRFTRDMISLAEGFDTWGDPERAEAVLRKIVDHREATNSLNDSDADLSIQHLVDLLLEGKRYSEAEQLLIKLASNPSLSQAANPRAYATNLERLALCHIATAQYPQAESELNQVVGLKESNGESSISLANTFETLGDLYRIQGKRGDAQNYYKKARAIFDRAVVSRKPNEKIDYQVYHAHLRQLDDKLKKL